MRGRAVILILAAGLLAGVAAGCGEEAASYQDKQIIERLDLEKAPETKGFVLGGDVFCEVDRELLNDADEVTEVADSDDPIVASRAGNVGVKPVPPFTPDCAEEARKKLSRLDPEDEG